jgi:hypothetical protein
VQRRSNQLETFRPTERRRRPVVYLVACNDRVNDRLETVGGPT